MFFFRGEKSENPCRTRNTKSVCLLTFGSARKCFDTMPMTIPHIFSPQNDSPNIGCAQSLDHMNIARFAQKNVFCSQQIMTKNQMPRCRCEWWCNFESAASMYGRNGWAFAFSIRLTIIFRRKNMCCEINLNLSKISLSKLNNKNFSPQTVNDQHINTTDVTFCTKNVRNIYTDTYTHYVLNYDMTKKCKYVFRIGELLSKYFPIYNRFFHFSSMLVVSTHYLLQLNLNFGVLTLFDLICHFLVFFFFHKNSTVKQFCK